MDLVCSRICLTFARTSTVLTVLSRSLELAVWPGMANTTSFVMNATSIISAAILMSILTAKGGSSILYKELNLIVGYSENEGWIGEKNPVLKNSIGFEWLKVFSNDFGDYLTTDLQMRLSYDTSGDFGDDWAIARALAASPDLLLADEPTGNLDSKNSLGIIELFGKLNREDNLTIIMTTRDEFLGKRSKRVIHLVDGKIH